jgi:predicted ferric reductase
MLTENAISPKSDPYYFERIGFRGAWVSLMQVPLVIILAARTNIVGFIIGSSYERLNWAHRWIARTLLVTVAVHSGFFLREWIRADFLQLELQIMGIVKYGMGAGGVLLWMNLSGLPFFRHVFYEFFVLQHLASIGVFLWLLYKHVPSYAMHFVWMAIGFVAFDRAARLLFLAFRNVRILSRGSKSGRLVDRIGYEAEIHASPGNVTQVLIRNIPFQWSAGQHVYIYIPRMGLIESHPFTISNACKLKSEPHTEITEETEPPFIELQIRAHSGFSRRLRNLAKTKSTLDNPLMVRCFLQGPYGSFPQWNTYDTLVLIAASTGASFTMPIFESVLANPCCVRRLHFLLLVRKRPDCSCYMSRLRTLARENKQLEVTIHVAVTSSDNASNEDDTWNGPIGDRCCCEPESCCCGAPEESDASEKGDATRISISSSPASDTISPSEKQQLQTDITSVPSARSAKSTSSLALTSSISPQSAALPLTMAATAEPTSVNMLSSRPTLDTTIRAAVESAKGETGVVVCGGKGLSGHVRNCVARLSDERGVHKGSGAQGIALHVEEFGF